MEVNGFPNITFITVEFTCGTLPTINEILPITSEPVMNTVGVVPEPDALKITDAVGEFPIKWVTLLAVTEDVI